MSPAVEQRIEVVPIERVIPSTYNPRKADAARLDLVELSLRKLGWLLPIYAAPAGEIISGHQRHLVAERMGAKRVPIVWTKEFDIEKRRGVNILFNRATNDIHRGETSFDMTAKLASQRELISAAAELPDHDVNSDTWFRCLHYTETPIRPVLLANKGGWDQYATNLAKSLIASAIWMPLVATPDLKIVNGIGRLECAAEKNKDSVPLVIISYEEARFAAAMLNHLSMDFDVHTRYADVLRYNSFRRSRGLKPNLGLAFLFDLFGDANSKSVHIQEPETRERWVKHYGNQVLDWGAGLLSDVAMLQAAGVNATPFEPFRLRPGTEDISPELSRETVRGFLKEVAAGTRWSSIFQNSVLNSVPFLEDRRHVLTLMAACCSPGTAVHACAISDQAKRLEIANGYELNSRTGKATTTFMLDYEPNVSLGEFSSKPKVQKFHSLEEWRGLWGELFEHPRCKAGYGGTMVCVVATCAKPVDQDRLRRAIEFEFDLPYPNNERMGLVAEAKLAFEQRLGLSFS